MNKRLLEILARKAEIKKSLEENKKELDLSAIETELTSLNQEEAELRHREEIAKRLNEGGIPAGVAPKGKPAEISKNQRNESTYDSLEYRQAFMNYVTKNQAIPVQYRDNTNTLTTDIGAVVPPTTLNRIIEKLEAYGMILPLVAKTNYKTGVAIPMSSVKPVATWVNEGATSDLQKKTVTSIVFGHYKLRCAVSVSLESEYMSLSAFEAALTNNIAEAMAKALEEAIISGDGNSKMTGILADLSKASGTVATAKLTYKNLTDAEANLPVEYENGAVWCMTKKTFMEFIGMTDSQGQPIARVEHGIASAPERYLLGRRVVICNYLATFVTDLKKTECFAFLYDFGNYIMNTNFQVGIKMYEDNETDDIVRKSIIVCDGKPVDYNSLVVLTGNATA